MATGVELCNLLSTSAEVPSFNRVPIGPRFAVNRGALPTRLNDIIPNDFCQGAYGETDYSNALLTKSRRRPKLNRARDGVNPDSKNKNRFDVLAEGLLVSSSRGDKTSFELFLGPFSGWKQVHWDMAAACSS